jgi:ubiquinone/menaquinone biosynthesis C-methylase UbiE
MTDDNKSLNQQQFSQYAKNFVGSAVHAKGLSLHRMVELVRPQLHWRMLDIATGGGHTALTFATFVRQMVASDLTHRMLTVARNYLTEQAATNATYCQMDAESLPFADESFDCVTCRIAPHHFPDVGRFVQEAARVLVSGGVLAVADNIVSGEAKIARYANLLDIFRDPSHHWAYSLDDWETFFFSAGLHVTASEPFQKETDFDEWAARVGVRGDDLVRLRALLIQAPAGVHEWYAPRQVGTRILFSITEAVIVGVKG